MKKSKINKFTVEIDRETDGRFIAGILEIPGVLCYGKTREEATTKAEALALRVVADQLEAKEVVSELTSIAFSIA